MVLPANADIRSVALEKDPVPSTLGECHIDLQAVALYILSMHAEVMEL